ncbi:hypothetical protein BDQ12DRAFT_686584 [Crucibulum laeve]|uniref:Uncharacterized protein n=1 Tax=Crucibulum laeve TaxID=68775 RepID=A0A5C3LTU1_9AGAR|nr:hypothetical protein BDQ12DRAFT_686584 [Crucibulum laeve]
METYVWGRTDGVALKHTNKLRRGGWRAEGRCRHLLTSYPTARSCSRPPPHVLVF